MTLIDGRMQFRITPASETDSDKPGAVALAWLDLAGDEDDSYLLVVEDQPTEKVAEFELMMYRCMWERDNNRDAKDAKKEELMLYRWGSPFLDSSQLIDVRLQYPAFNTAGSCCSSSCSDGISFLEQADLAEKAAVPRTFAQLVRR